MGLKIEKWFNTKLKGILGVNFFKDLFDDTKDLYTRTVALETYTTPNYKRYVALLTQADTDAPVATILENTLGEVPTWTYGDVGLYYLNSTSKFTTNKTVVFITNGVDAADSMGAEVASFTPNQIAISTQTVLEAPANGILNSTPIEIRVYP